MAQDSDSDRLVIKDVTLRGSDFSGQRLRRVAVVNSRLLGCDFSRVRANHVGLGSGPHPSEYVECAFDGARLSNLLGMRARFVRCSFRNVQIRNMRAQDAEFIDCVFSGRLREVIFSAVPKKPESIGRTRNEFSGNDFSGANLIDVDFRKGIDLSGQWLPDEGEDYVYVRNIPAAVIRARAEVRSWADPELRQKAEIRLDLMEARAQEGQRDMFEPVTELVKNRDHGLRLAAALRETGRFG